MLKHRGRKQIFQGNVLKNICNPSLPFNAINLKSPQIRFGYFLAKPSFLQKQVAFSFPLGLQLEVSKFFIYTLLLFLTRFSTASACLLISSSVELLAHAKLCVSVPLIFMLVSINTNLCRGGSCL